MYKLYYIWICDMYILYQKRQPWQAGTLAAQLRAEAEDSGEARAMGKLSWIYGFKIWLVYG